MVLTKKGYTESFFFFSDFWVYFFYSFSRPLDVSNAFFAVPFRIILFLISCYIIYVNFENIVKRKSTVIFTVLFGCSIS